MTKFFLGRNEKKTEYYFYTKENGVENLVYLFEFCESKCGQKDEKSSCYVLMRHAMFLKGNLATSILEVASNPDIAKSELFYHFLRDIDLCTSFPESLDWVNKDFDTEVKTFPEDYFS